VAGRVERLGEQVESLAHRSWDVVALQEITPTTLRPWREALQRHGLVHVRSSMDDWIPGEPTPDGRRLGVLVAARDKLERLACVFLPWPERLLSVRVHSEPPFDLHNLHSPISSKPNLVKIRTHRALHEYLSRPPESPQLVVGDLNTPRRELPDGSVWTFARDSRGKLRLDRGERWERAELALIRGLEQSGYRDVFRALHGPDLPQISWTYPSGRGGYRLDHVIASNGFRPLACEYLDEPRQARLSDHSPVWAELAIPKVPPGAARSTWAG
jgi:endonuclease/exonuclease/phosphatase family metal-dependent hydrolase